ncbi:MAG: aminotransferase class IV [Spirochaetales bacterium]|nr:aminotransferase class IV [Spirochaetales bacterium]
MAFTLSIHPWVHLAQYNGTEWIDNDLEQEHQTPEQEAALPEAELDALMVQRNSFPGLPLVNYTTQYGLGCFEGLKAFPQPDGSLKLFRPDQNCQRMASSMKGLMMPAVKPELLLDGIRRIVAKNAQLGFAPAYDAEWEKDHWLSGAAVYIRPFAYSEPGIGINLSKKPWVVTVCTNVSAYFTPGANAAVTSQRIRATKGGTGWIKTAANYVTSTLAKTEAINDGYMEAIFLDAETRENIEEGSSCNFFALFPGGQLVTPELGDTILPGITRSSIIELARSKGYTVREEPLSIHRVLSDAKECFVTGTAAGITPLGSLTHDGVKKEFSSLEDGSTANTLLKELKGIQYGAVKDGFNWMMDVK